MGGPQEPRSCFNPDFREIGIRRHAGFLFEQPDVMSGTDTQFICGFLNADGILVMPLHFIQGAEGDDAQVIGAEPADRFA